MSPPENEIEGANAVDGPGGVVVVDAVDVEVVEDGVVGELVQAEIQKAERQTATQTTRVKDIAAARARTLPRGSRLVPRKINGLRRRLSPIFMGRPLVLTRRALRGGHPRDAMIAR